jgi:formylglycine-generating enzyme required for sulfatase activity
MTNPNQSGSGPLAQGADAPAAGERGVGVKGNVGGSINTGTQIINNYLAGGQVRDPEQLEAHIRSYLRWVQARCGHVELRGIERGGRKVLTLDLDKAYVPLQATVAAPREERAGLLGLLDRLRVTRPALKGKPRELLDEAEQVKGAIQMDEVLGLGNQLVVTGGPGCGKTTVLLHIAWTLATAILDGSDLAQEKLGLERPLPVPIFIPLAAYARRLRELKRQSNGPSDPRERTLSAFVTHYLIGREHDFDLPADFFVQVLSTGRSVMLLLDGLDEVSNEDEREVVRQAVEDLVNGRPDMRVIVTCRTAAYRGQTALGGGFREVVVTPLEEDCIREMVERFYGCIYPDQPKQAQASTDELMKGVADLERARGQQQRLIDSPLMVRLLLIVHYNDRRMPEQRAELFQKAAETMIQLDYLPDVEVSQELKAAVGKSWTDQYEMVQHLAFHLHSQGEGQGRELDEDELCAAFAGTDYAGYVDALVDYTRNRGGLLEERMGAYRFIHLGFQEYLVARYLIEVKAGEEGIESVACFFEGGPILESWWREPALLIPGYCVANSKSGLARSYLRRLAGTPGARYQANLPALSPEVQLAAAEIAGSAALDLRETDEKLRADLAARLATLYEDDRLMTGTSARRRAAAGVALGRLGDPRPYATDVDAMRLCVVPAGPFRMGSAPDDKDAYDDEKTLFPQHNVDYDYAIGQHPITNAQFKAFVQDKGYANPDWWAAAIHDDCWAVGKVKRRVLFYEDEKNEKVGERFEEADTPFDFGRPFGLANHPVVGINWYEALAFCAWLTARWRERGWLGERQRVQLPNEPEWEKAARGGLAIPVRPIVISPPNLAAEAQNPESQIANPKPARIYPWGDDDDTNRMNCDKTGIRATSAAACFPGGCSPYGCHDLSGNVWDWTRTIWGPWRLEKNGIHADLKFRYPYETNDGREDELAGQMIARVLRGGSWRYQRDFARCAYRLGDFPVARDFNVGFRVVVR